MRRFHALLLARPWLVLGLFALGWLAALPGLLRLELATDGRALVPRDAPALADDARIRADFGVGDELALVLRAHHPDGIWNERTLARVAEISAELAREPLVDARHVRSLATEPGDSVWPGRLELRAWLEPPPADAAQVAQLRARVEKILLYRGTLVAREQPARATCIVFRLAEGADRRAACARLARFASERSDGEHELALVGAAVAESRLGDHLLSDLALLVPAAFLVLALVLWAGFKSRWAVLLPLAGVGWTLSTTLALMGWLGAPIYLTVLVLPVILASVGIAAALHVQDRFLAELRARGADGARAALEAALSQTTGSVLAAELTTALGFASFAASPLPPVRTFGIFATCGVALCLAWALAALPCALALCAARGAFRAQAERAPRLRTALAAFCAGCAAKPAARPLAWLAGAALVAGACALGASRVRIQDSWLDGFAPASPTRRAAEALERDFAGVHELRVAVDARVASAEGLFGPEDVDAEGLWIPESVFASVSEIAGHRLEIRPVGLAPGDARDQPITFRVEDVRWDPSGRTLLAVRHLQLPLGLRDLLDSAQPAYHYRLSARDRLADPGTLARLARLEAFLAAQADLGVGAVLGPHAHLLTVDQIHGSSPEASAKRLSTHEGIARTLDLYARARGEERLGELWHPERDRALATVLVRGANFERVGQLFGRLRQFERDELRPHGLSLTLGGDLALSQAMIDGIVRSQVGSLAFALLTILFVAAVWTRSLLLGLCCALPCSLAVLGDFALMGWGGVPLGVATSMFAAMILGVGVDYAVHLARRARREAAAGASAQRAIAAAFADVGPPVVLDAAAVGLGFLLLCLSSVPPTRNLGALLVASLALCTAATLCVLPAVLALALRGHERPAG